MNHPLRNFLIVFLLVASLAPSAHADFFGDLARSATSFFSDVGRVVVGAVNAVASAINNFVVQPIINNVITPISRIISPQPSRPIGGATPSPSGGTGAGAPSGYNPAPSSGDGGGYASGGSSPSSIPTYERSTYTYTSSPREVGFAELNLTNLYIDTLIENDDAMAGNYVNVFHEITNIGGMPGKTKWRNQVECYAVVDSVGNTTGKYEVEQRTDWIQSGELPPGAIKSFLTVWLVPEEKYSWGGKCRVKSEIAENVTKKNVIENVWCTVYTWATGGSSQDCQTSSSTETITVETGARKTVIEKEFIIRPKLPKISGSIQQSVDGIGS